MRQQAAAAAQLISQAQHAIAHAEGAADLHQGAKFTHRTYSRRWLRLCFIQAARGLGLQPFVHDEELIIFLAVGLSDG